MPLEKLKEKLARFECSLFAFSPSGASINHSSDHHCSPPLTSSTRWPGAEPVSGQGPDPWTLARASGPMGWGHQSCDPSSQGYLLLWHNAIGHSHQNDGAQGILHADHSNGCWPPRPTLASARVEENGPFDIISQMPFCVCCLTSILCFKVF